MDQPKPRYVFFGTPDFSAACLRVFLQNDFVPVAVVCNPDRPTGRKKIMTAPPVKMLAEEWNADAKKMGSNHGAQNDSGHSPIEILQPEKLDVEFQIKLRELDADFFVVYAYNKIFRKAVLDIPRLGTIGIHPSLLPEYRGPSPFQTAILDGKTSTGVTLYFLDEGIDSGPILAKTDPIAISDQDTFTTLAMTLANAGAELLLNNLDGIVSGKLAPIPQDESQATYTKKFRTEDGFIDNEDLEMALSGDERMAWAIAPEN